MNLTVAIVAAFASTVISRMGRKVAIILIVFFIPFSYILLGILPLIPAVTILFIFYAVRGYATPLLKDLANIHCESATRATVLSIRNMIIRIGFAVLGPFIGSLSASHGLPHALVTSGGILLLLSVVAACYLWATGAGEIT
ncbi:MAG: hypothetical protein HQK66_01220 [Desulfamplus sp.]|nr:hypothetical protein [Desulfamplus sp.]